MINQLTKILIVDDTPINLQILANMLMQHGYVVRAAVNGVSAIKLVQVELPDLILLDIMMADMNGYEVCQHLKANQATQHIPIIFISALNQLKDKMKAFEMGGVDYITKPFEIGEVLARVKTHLALRAAEIALEKANQQLEEQVAVRTAALVESATRYRTIFENSNDVIFMTTSEGDIIDINPVCVTIFGYSQAEMLTMKAADFYLTPQAYEQFNETLKKEGTVREFEVKLKKKNGVFDALLSATLQIGTDGNVAGFQGFVRDITEQKQAEALQVKYHRTLEQQVEERTRALEESNRLLTQKIYEHTQTEEELRKLSQAVEQTTSAIMITDTNGVIEYVNPQFVSLTGYTATEAIGQMARLLQSGLTPIEIYEDLWQTITSGQGWHHELLNKRKDGSLYWTSNTISPIHNRSGDITHFVAIQEDITTRKNVEKELRQAKEEADTANRAKSTFLATMSHEIRTPMNIIMGMTSLLLDTKLTVEQQDFAETIQDSSEGLLTIINDILDFSKVESGRLELENEPLDLQVCLQDTLNLLASKANEKTLKLAYLIDEGTPTTIYGDITRLRQILLNLINNAIKFTEVGEVTVSVGSLLINSATENQSPTYMLLFSVRDTGIGIPSDRLDKLFQPFSQVDASITRRYGGSGLGLVISQKLCEMMGGTISVESEVGVGTTFYFTMTTQAVLNETKNYLQDFYPQLSGRRVLIVDSNPISLRLLNHHVDTWGMESHQTDNPETAWAWIEAQEPFEVAILEIGLPKINGVTLAQAIRQLEETENRRPLPLILIMSQPEAEIPQPLADQQAEFTIVLNKPIKPSNLFDGLMTIFTGTPTRIQAQVTSRNVGFDRQMGKKFPLSILLVEDNLTNQKLANLMLGRLGYQADIASNGFEAIDALKKQTYDVVFMDIQMPHMDGLEATRQIRQMWPTTVKPPHIIAMTANAMQGDQERCLQAGMDDYISKPIRVEALITALLEAVTILDESSISELNEAIINKTTSANISRPTEVANSSADSSQPTLDTTALDNLLEMIGGESALLAELINSFIEETAKLLVIMQEAITNNNAREVRRGAHTIKSSARDFGAIRLATLCQELEQLSKTGMLAEADSYINQIEAEYAQVKAGLTTQNR